MGITQFTLKHINFLKNPFFLFLNVKKHKKRNRSFFKMETDFNDRFLELRKYNLFRKTKQKIRFRFRFSTDLKKLYLA